MRRLKLEMQVSADGFAAEADGGTDWMIWNWAQDWGWDAELRHYHLALNRSSDCILLSRVMAEEGFYEHWRGVAGNAGNPQADFARAVMDMRKVVFSKTLAVNRWPNTDLATGDLADEVDRLKRQDGKDLIAYGGPTFAAALTEAGLIDDYHFIVNPAVVGRGRPILGALRNTVRLRLLDAHAFPRGVAVLHYARG